MTKSVKQEITWLEGATLYQIYPRSFKDSNGDGIGDLGGIIQYLDYLNDGKGNGLGVTGIWLSPFYPSPMADFGYDVSDFCGVDPMFGTIDDFDQLLKEAHIRGIKVLIDFVPNHSSNQHPWFIESSSSRHNPKRDWYVWKDAKDDGSPPNNWLSVFGGPAWTFDAQTNQYYLHSFLKEQPDLNWENPEVREAMFDNMRWWLNRGVDGFRVDAVNLMGKDYGFPNNPLNPYYMDGHDPYNKIIHKYSRDSGKYYDYLSMMKDVVQEYDDRVLVFETWMTEGNKPELYREFFERIGSSKTMPFNFELIFLPWQADMLQSFIDRMQHVLKADYFAPYVLGNHDQSRLASRIGSESARMAAMLLLTLPGVAFIYNGEEIGMTDVVIPEESLQDPAGKQVPQLSRDKCRTPMQWTSGKFAGFSTAQPWLPLAPDYKNVNVAKQITDNTSIMSLYKTLIYNRNTIKAFHSGEYKPGTHISKEVISYERINGTERYLVFLNFSGAAHALKRIPKVARLFLSTDSARTSADNKILKPYEGLILKV